MQVERLHKFPSIEASLERERRIKHVGEQMAKQFLVDRTLLLDMDGVIMKGDSLHAPQLTDPLIIPALQGLEKIGVKIGPATGRSAHVLHFLRAQGLQMTGPAILEEGQTLIRDGVTEHFGHPNHRAFMESMGIAMKPELVDSWDKVRRSYTRTFCLGNEQWQGDCRSSFWFYYDDVNNPNHDRHDRLIAAKFFTPRLYELAKYYRLNLADLAVSVYRMKPSEENGNLAIIGLKGKLNGNIITKATAVRKLYQDRDIVAPVFIADGFGDMPVVEEMYELYKEDKDQRKKKGLVLGLKGNLDISGEPNAFLNEAGKENVLDDPRELAESFAHAATILQREQYIDAFKPTLV